MNNNNLIRFLLTFFLGWIGSLIINHTSLKPEGYTSRTGCYLLLSIVTFGIYALVASSAICSSILPSPRTSVIRRTNPFIWTQKGIGLRSLFVSFNLLLFGDVASFDWLTISYSNFHSIGLGTLATTVIYSPVKDFIMFYTTVYSLPLSRISLGTAPFGASVSRETAFSILDRYLEYGGNLLDTAAVYGFGLSEQTIGAWMQKRGSRDKVYISTKGAHPSLPDWRHRVNETEIRADMEASLRNLNVDCVDIYYLHRDDENLPVDAIMPLLDRLVCEGKTRYLGASNWTVSRINEANAFAHENGLTEFSFSQIMWSTACINKEGIYDQTLVVMDEKEFEGYRQNGLPVMAYTSQAQGLFSLIQKNGYENLSDPLIRTYMNDTTKARADRILALAAETGLSPTAISLGSLLISEVYALPIIGVSSIAHLEDSMQVLDIYPQLCDEFL